MITSSNFKGDWKGYLKNQIGHAAIGYVAIGFLGFAPVVVAVSIVAVLYWLIIEQLMQPESRYGGSKFYDGLEDAMHVTFGAVMRLGNPVTLVLWVVLLGYGAWLRK